VRRRSDPPVSLVRLAEFAEAAAIAAILQAAFAEYGPLYTPLALAATTPGQRQIEQRWDEGPVWVAEVDGRLAGTVAAVDKGDGLYVRSMAVLPEARGLRLGERLLQAVDDYAQLRGLDRLYLSTTPFLHRAIRLYERWGFRRTDASPHELFGTPLFTMAKVVGPLR